MTTVILGDGKKRKENMFVFSHRPNNMIVVAF